MLLRSKSHRDLLQFDPEIEKHLKKLKKDLEKERAGESNQGPKLENMADEPRSIRQLSTQGVTRVPSCIREPVIPQGQTFELKSSLLHHLPVFHGLPAEDPNRHLMDFQFTCKSMKPANADFQTFQMRAFPFSLADKAKDWLYKLPNEHITSWDQMVKVFLDKFFPTSRMITLRKQITGIQQGPMETYPEFYERFQALITQCPQHQFNDTSLLQYFYEGLQQVDRDMLDAASGGCFMDKTPDEAKELIANRASNAQQYAGLRTSTKSVNEVSSVSKLEDQISKLTAVISQVMVPNPTALAQVCGICSVGGHTTENCPQHVECPVWESANAVGYQGQNQQGGNPFSNTYNPGWKNHPNFRWGNNNFHNNAAASGSNAPPGFPAKPQVLLNSNSNNSVLTNPNYDKMFEMLTRTSQSLDKTTQILMQTQQVQGNDIAEMKKQMGDLVNTVSRIREQGKLPGGTIPNPTFEQAKAITTRTETVVRPACERTEDDKDGAEKQRKISLENLAKNSENSDKAGKVSNLSSSVSTNAPLVPMPFPSRFAESKKYDDEKEILETFKKVQVNLPLLDAIKQIPKYAKFLKELCTTRRRIREKEVVKVSENVSAIIQRKLPPKCKDPGSFTIPCIIGNNGFEHALLDLGASINVMPYSVYLTLGLGELKTDNVIIQLADRSHAYPKGLLEDVLVQVNDLIFPADFYILDMEESKLNKTQLLLGRPFLRTARTKIDVYSGSLTMEFDGEKIEFNIFDSLRYPIDEPT